MKKTLYLVIALMLAITITGCSSSVKEKNTSDAKKTEEKATKKEEKKETKKEENKKEEKKEEKKETKKEEKTDDKVDHILSCNIVSDDYTGKADIKWINDIIEQISFNITVPLNDPSITDDVFDAVVDVTTQLMKSNYGIDENTEGAVLTTESNKEARTLTFNINLDLTKASKDILSNLGFNISDEDLKAGIDDIKADMELNGFTCKKEF